MAQKKVLNDQKFEGDVEFVKAPTGLTAAAIVPSTTNFNNNLSSADDTVQKALDTLDNISIGAGVSWVHDTPITLDSTQTISMPADPITIYNCCGTSAVTIDLPTSIASGDNGKVFWFLHTTRKADIIRVNTSEGFNAGGTNNKKYTQLTPTGNWIMMTKVYIMLSKYYIAMYDSGYGTFGTY